MQFGDWSSDVCSSDLAFAGKTKQELFELFHASANGLTEEQIERSRENYGENAISYGDRKSVV